MSTNNKQSENMSSVLSKRKFVLAECTCGRCGLPREAARLCEQCGSPDTEIRERWEYLQGTVRRHFCDDCWLDCKDDPAVRAPWERSDWVEPRGRAPPSNLTEREKTDIGSRYEYPYTPPAAAQQRVSPKPSFEDVEMKCECGQSVVARVEQPIIWHAGYYYHRALSEAERASFAGKTSRCADCRRKKVVVVSGRQVRFAGAKSAAPAAVKAEE